MTSLSCSIQTSPNGPVAPLKCIGKLSPRFFVFCCLCGREQTRLRTYSPHRRGSVAQCVYLLASCAVITQDGWLGVLRQLSSTVTPQYLTILAGYNCKAWQVYAIAHTSFLGLLNRPCFPQESNTGALWNCLSNCNTYPHAAANMTVLSELYREKARSIRLYSTHHKQSRPQRLQ